jgi:hypothetical protein
MLFKEILKKMSLLLITGLFLQCTKQNEWLDVKANNNDVILSKLEDYRALLDDERTMNMRYPGLGIVSSDNFYTTFEVWQAAGTEVERNAYLWLPDVFNGASVSDWNTPYWMVASANIVLEGLDKLTINEEDMPLRNAIKGSALFYRSYAFYNLLQLFGQPYSVSSNDDAPGIPIRTVSDVNVKIGRSSLKDSYQQIIDDLKRAAELLPERADLQTRPSKIASKALLARLYLNIGNYSLAEKYADEALDIYHELFDFNSLSTISAYSIAGYPDNPEIIFYAETEIYGLSSFRRFEAIVDSLLYKKYEENDLRKYIFYTDPDIASRVYFKGQYTGKSASFGGIATNELFFIKAEAQARLGDYVGGLNVLNSLLKTRWIADTFEPVTVNNSEEALEIILKERRKEFPFTGLLRWEDLRRLNKEKRFEKTLMRQQNGVDYSLPPNDLRYVFPIPHDEMRLNSMEQNPR